VARFFFVVFTNPVEGREDEFQQWYDHTHIADVRRVEGVTSGLRLRPAAAMDDATPCPWQSMAMYEIEAPTAQAARDAMGRAAEAGAMPLSPALELTDIRAWFFEPVAEG
jgi:hypothetical protein